MTYLLDVNVLIALTDRSHIHHATAVRWFETVGCVSWATCPITENGVLRIVGNPRYRNSVGSIAVLSLALKEFTELPDHVFWPDTISLLHSGSPNLTGVSHSNHLTDIYLLLLARAYGGQLATFDRKIPTAAMEAGSTLLRLIAE